MLPTPSAPGLNLASLRASRYSLASAAQAYAGEVQNAMRGVLGAVTRFEQGRRLLCQEALAGRAAEVQSDREPFLRVFEDELCLLGEARELVRFAERVAGRELPEAAQLQQEEDVLRTS